MVACFGHAADCYTPDSDLFRERRRLLHELPFVHIGLDGQQPVLAIIQRQAVEAGLAESGEGDETAILLQFESACLFLGAVLGIHERDGQRYVRQIAREGQDGEMDVPVRSAADGLARKVDREDLRGVARKNVDAAKNRSVRIEVVCVGIAAAVEIEPARQVRALRNELELCQGECGFLARQVDLESIEDRVEIQMDLPFFTTVLSRGGKQVGLCHVRASRVSVPVQPRLGRDGHVLENRCLLPCGESVLHGRVASEEVYACHIVATPYQAVRPRSVGQGSIAESATV